MPTLPGMRGKCLVAVSIAGVAAGLIAASTANAEDFDLCPSGMTAVATEDTSCAFAENVRSAWEVQPASSVTAFSPVTQQTYTMQCSSATTDIWSRAQRCVGANDYGVTLIVAFTTNSSVTGPTSGNTGSNSQPPLVMAPGVGVDAPNTPDAPNIGCTWVNGYTRSNGTHVSGYMRC